MSVVTPTDGRHSFVTLSTRAAILTWCIVIAMTLSIGALALLTAARLAQREQGPVDVVIVGAGIAGLSAALEAARAGASVLVVDISTVGGGHAILSNGAVSIIGTPLQERQKIADSPSLAEKDFLDEQSHAKALSRQYACSSCHADLLPYRATAHRLDRSSVVTYCRACHGVQPREGPPARPEGR